MNPSRRIRQEAYKLRHLRRSMLRAASDMNYHPVDLQISLEEIALHMENISEILDTVADDIPSA